MIDRWRRRAVGTAAAALLVALLLGSTTASAATQPPTNVPPFDSIGIRTIELDARFRSIEDPYVLAAFVETGSTDRRCLATLNELAGPLPRALFCAPRAPTFDGAQLGGVWLHVFFDEPIPDDFYLSVNLYQEHAGTEADGFWTRVERCEAAEGC